MTAAMLWQTHSIGGGVAYSFGIADEVSWDVAMSQIDYEIFMYDMTIDGLPEENPKFHFFKEGIGGVKEEKKSLDTLENFIKRNGHENNQYMILKMDVEGAEWDFLETVSLETLNQFDQIIFEFHDMVAPKNFYQMGRTLALIEKLNITHALIHLHGNNFSKYVLIEGIGIIPDVLELTYLNRANRNFVDDAEIFLPTPVDFPNNPNLPEISLGFWNKFQ